MNNTLFKICFLYIFLPFVLAYLNYLLRGNIFYHYRLGLPDMPGFNNPLAPDENSFTQIFIRSIDWVLYLAYAVTLLSIQLLSSIAWKKVSFLKNEKTKLITIAASIILLEVFGYFLYLLFTSQPHMSQAQGINNIQMQNTQQTQLPPHSVQFITTPPTK